MTADRERFAEMYRREYPAVLAFAARRTQPARAEDIAHETFLTAWRRSDAIPADPAAIRPWLYAIARNHLMHDHRELSRRDALTIRIAETTPTSTEGPERLVTASTDLVRAWRSLTAEQQEVLALVGWEELTSAEAGQVLGITATAFRHRLRKARAALRAALASATQSPQSPSRSHRTT